jgi:uncharacterized protein (DUF362 family)
MEELHMLARVFDKELTDVIADFNEYTDYDWWVLDGVKGYGREKGKKKEKLRTL